MIGNTPRVRIIIKPRRARNAARFVHSGVPKERVCHRVGQHDFYIHRFLQTMSSYDIVIPVLYEFRVQYRVLKSIHTGYGTLQGRVPVAYPSFIFHETSILLAFDCEGDLHEL